MEFIVAELLITLPLIFSAINLLPFPKFHWGFEVNLSLAIYYLLIHLIAILYLLLRRKRFQPISFLSRLFLLLLCSLWYVREYRVFYIAPPSAPLEAEHGSFTMLYANVLTQNENYEDLKSQILSRQPNIVALVEVNETWLDRLNLAEIYPYRVEIPRRDNYGLAVYSTLPFLSEPERDIGSDLPPLISVSLNPTDGEPVHFSLVHAFPPVSQANLYGRKVVLKRISGKTRFMSGRVILAGDFNATPLSHVYYQFIDSGFSNAMWGYGLQATWRPLLMRAFSSTIDHVFYKGALRVDSFERLGFMGSDHYPLFVRFSYGG